MRDNFEVITTDNKTQRDEMFQDLKRNGNALERQVVKFSGSRQTEEGNWVSTWSLAYPRTDRNGNVPAATPITGAGGFVENLRELVEASNG